MKMSLIERESKDKITSLWMEYHSKKTESISYVLSKNEFEIFKRNSTESPFFLLPIKRKSGYFMMMG